MWIRVLVTVMEWIWKQVLENIFNAILGWIEKWVWQHVLVPISHWVMQWVG